MAPPFHFLDLSTSISANSSSDSDCIFYGFIAIYMLAISVSICIYQHDEYRSIDEYNNISTHRSYLSTTFTVISKIQSSMTLVAFWHSKSNSKSLASNIDHYSNRCPSDQSC